VVGILADDDHLHLIEGTEVEGVEDESPRRVACGCSVFLPHTFCQLLEIGLGKLALQPLLPRFFYLYVHIEGKVTIFQSNQQGFSKKKGSPP
jgi:hypothetical protein